MSFEYDGFPHALDINGTLALGIRFGAGAAALVWDRYPLRGLCLG